MSQIKAVLFILNIALGTYFINSFFQFIQISEQILKFESWFILFGGILLYWGAITSLKKSPKI